MNTDARRNGDRHLVRDGDQYLVIVGGDVIGQVHKARVSTGRYRYESPSMKGRGRTRWFASPGVNDEDFGTRKEAVAELLRRRA